MLGKGDVENGAGSLLGDEGDNLDNSGQLFQGRRADNSARRTRQPLLFALGINQGKKVTRFPNAFENDLGSGRCG